MTISIAMSTCSDNVVLQLNDEEQPLNKWLHRYVLGHATKEPKDAHVPMFDADVVTDAGRNGLYPPHQ